MAKLLPVLLLTLALVAASTCPRGGAVLSAAADDAPDLQLQERRETMAEIIRVFSNPVLTADADAETTRRLWLFMQRELGPLGTLLDAIVDMPEESADDVRTKVEAFHAVQGLMIQHFRPLLGPHGSGASRTQLLSGLLMQMAGVANQTSEADSLEDTM